MQRAAIACPTSAPAVLVGRPGEGVAEQGKRSRTLCSRNCSLMSCTMASRFTLGKSLAALRIRRYSSSTCGMSAARCSRAMGGPARSELELACPVPTGTDVGGTAA